MKIKLPEKFTVSESVSGKSQLDHLAEALNIRTLAGKAALEVALTNVMLLDKKQLDYGPRNISSFGLLGVVIRMNDKFERLKTLLFDKGRRSKANNESIADSFNDVCNYAIIARLLDEKRWPDSEPLCKK